jgi:hypothetical protein
VTRLTSKESLTWTRKQVDDRDSPDLIRLILSLSIASRLSHGKPSANHGNDALVEFSVWKNGAMALSLIIEPDPSTVSGSEKHLGNSVQHDTCSRVQSNWTSFLLFKRFPLDPLSGHDDAPLIAPFPA